jgi:hypothetical protein
VSSALKSKQGIIAAGALGLIVVLAAGWLLAVSPKRKDAQSLEAQVATAQTELAQKKADLARPSASIRVRPGDLYRLSKALPDSSDQATVLLDVDNLATRNHLSFGAISPQASIAGTGYLQQPYSVTIEGRFTDVSHFLGDVRKLVKVKKGTLEVAGRVYSIDQVTLGEGENHFPNVKAVVMLSSFTYFQAPPASPVDGTQPTTTGDGTVAAGATP